MQAYVEATGARLAELLEAWKKLEPYRVTIPLDCDQLSAEFFFANLRISLAILQAHQETRPDS